MSASPIEVEAEVIEPQELAIDVDGISLSLDGLREKALAINGAIAEAVRAAGELAADDDVIAAMGHDEAREHERSLSAAITAAEDARKAFNGDYDTPKKRVGTAYQEAMEAVKALHGRYKARRVEAEEEVKAGHYKALEDAYLDFMEGNGLAELAAAVPLERFCEDRWWNSAAKGFSERNAENAMLKRATEIVADWNSVKSAPYRYPEQAQATFFRTLSLRDVNEQDARMWEEAQRVAAVNAEVEASRSYCEPERCEQAPAVVAPDGEVPAEQPETWVLCVDLTPSQYDALIGWFRANGVHGLPMRTPLRGWEQAAQMVKEACND